MAMFFAHMERYSVEEPCAVCGGPQLEDTNGVIECQKCSAVTEDAAPLTDLEADFYDPFAEEGTN